MTATPLRRPRSTAPRTAHSAGAVFAIPTVAVQVPKMAAHMVNEGISGSDIVRRHALRAMRSRYIAPLLARRDSRGAVILLSDPVTLMAARRLRLSHVPVVIINDSSPDLRLASRMIGHTAECQLSDNDETRMVATLTGMGLTHERIAEEFGRSLTWVEERLADLAERDRRPTHGPRLHRSIA